MNTGTPANGRVGAYGFAFDGIQGGLLNPCPTDWPQVAIRQQVGARKPIPRSLKESRAEFPLLDGGSVVVRRDPPDGTYHVVDTLTSDELAHPFLVPVAAVHAFWNGYDTFHAGGFVVDGRAWAILASREGGKSSLLAALAVAGYAIVSDDLTVTDGKRVFAGPRSIDLRKDAVPQFPVTRSLGVAGRRPRWRLDPGPVAPEIPLAGWITLEWSPEYAASRIDPGERIRLLSNGRSLKGPSPDPHRMLRLAALPMWAISRPRGWEGMPQVLDLLLEKVT